MINPISNSRGGVATAAIVAAVLGLVIGFGGAKLINKPEDAETTSTTTSTTPAPDPTTKAADLRVLLNGLDREHVELAAAATRAGFDGRPEFAAVAAQLDKNSNDIADAVGSVYGPEARTKFYDIWKSHVGFFVDYTTAAKKNDKAGMEKAVKNLEGYVEAVSTFLSSANPNLPKQAVAELFTEHVGLLKGTVDAHAGKDYVKSYDQQHATSLQVGKIADALAGAIVKQNPDKF